MSTLATAQAEAPFVSESDLLIVGRDDQADSLKTKMLREEVTIMDAGKVLTTYKVVTREQYFEFAHQPGATGSATVKGRGVCLWEIEPKYAGVVTLSRGALVYLLRPDLRPRISSRRSPAFHLRSSQSWKTFRQGQPLVFEGSAAAPIHRPAPSSSKSIALIPAKLFLPVSTTTAKKLNGAGRSSSYLSAQSLSLAVAIV